MANIKSVGWGWFPLPGEKKRIAKAEKEARRIMQLVQEDSMTKEVTSIEFEYAEICALMESGTVEVNSPLYVKLRTARDRFRAEPKVYGNGLNRKTAKEEN